jgi:hypothetical protein
MNGASIAERLVGTWSIVEYVATADDGSVVHPMGPHLSGLIIYGADGVMGVQIMQVDRPRWGRASTGAARSEERVTAADGYLAYSGTYEVDEEARVVVHQLQVALVPNWVGTAQRRAVMLDGDRLELTAPATFISDAVRTARLTWRRVA